jgi:hypothetical protein
MFCSVLRKNINYKGFIKPLQKQYIHNHSYNILRKELNEKDIVIKKLKDYIKKLECENNSLNATIDKLKYQNSLDLLYNTNNFKSESR